MAAKLQRLVLFWGLCFIVSMVTLCVALDRPWWGAAVPALALSIYPLVIGIELCVAYVVSRQSGAKLSASPPPLSCLLRAWIGEIKAGGKSFAWEQPFRTQTEPDCLPPSAHGIRGVVFVHGLFCNRGFWNAWMRQYRSGGKVPFVAVTLEPLFCSIDDYVPMLDAAIARITAVTGALPVVVAHSMGGLVVRRWLCTQRLQMPVHRIITIGTPHSGTWLARFASGENGREMAVDSAWLRRLKSTSRVGDENLFTCFFSNCDNVVFPPENATLAHADNRMLSANGHVQLAAHPAVMAEVQRLLDDSDIRATMLACR